MGEGIPIKPVIQRTLELHISDIFYPIALFCPKNKQRKLLKVKIKTLESLEIMEGTGLPHDWALLYGYSLHSFKSECKLLVLPKCLLLKGPKDCSDKVQNTKKSRNY